MMAMVDRELLIEVRARALCRADGRDPDRSIGMVMVDRGGRWVEHDTDMPEWERYRERAAATVAAEEALGWQVVVRRD